MGRPSWLKTPPMSWPLASVVTRNGFAKSGNARIGSDMRASLSKMRLAQHLHSMQRFWIS